MTINQNIRQKNVFGDNVVMQNVRISRDLDVVGKEQLQDFLVANNIEGVTIRYEAGGETRELADKVRSMISGFGITSVNMTAVMMSEIGRGQFTIEQHPTDKKFAVVRIGSLF
jgi:hypothetical protein